MTEGSNRAAGRGPVAATGHGDPRRPAGPEHYVIDETMRQDGAVTRGSNGRLAGIRGGLSGGLRDLFAAPAAGASAHAAADSSTDARDPLVASGTPASSPAGLSLRPPVAGPEEIRKQRMSGLHRWYAGALVGLSFLLVAMVQAATSGGSLGSIIAFEALAVCFAAVYLFAPVRVAGGTAFTGASGGTLGKAATLGSMLAITVPMIALGGIGVTALWIYVGVVAAIMFRLPVSLGLSVLLAGVMLLLWGVGGDGLPWELALTLVALSLWMSGFAGNIRLTIELRSTREELARAAVAAERARIGRDLHDILGHSLTAIAVKAGLARRLAERDAAAGAPAVAGRVGAQIVSEIGDVERLAREALADVRATAAGYRDVSLAGELAVARSVLSAAGIQAELPTAVDDVSPVGREVFGYVVREAVTNVVRHSGARRCVIELGRCSVKIRDDGSGPAGPGETGAGLRGLAERLAAVGGTLSAGAGPDGGFRVHAELDGSAAGVAG